MGIEIRHGAPLLQVFDMPTSLKFYCEVLGFKIAGTDKNPAPNHDWVLLRRNSVELMLNTAYEAPERPSQPDAGRVSAHEDTCLFYGCPDVDAAYKHVREKGISAKEPAIAPYGMKQLWLKDPDGYGICFQWPAERK